jgi:hypothetical protein
MGSLGKLGEDRSRARPNRGDVRVDIPIIIEPGWALVGEGVRGGAGPVIEENCTRQGVSWASTVQVIFISTVRLIK